MTKPSSSAQPLAVFRRRADVRHRVVGGQAVIIVQEAGEAIVLNAVGTRILELIDQNMTREEIIADVESQFDAERDRISSDLDGYLADLEEAGVIERVAPPAEAD